MEVPITQATGHNNTIVSVYPDRVELKTGWQGQNIERIGLRDIAAVSSSGVVNVTLTLQTNTGQLYKLSRMALPDARRVKTAIEQQKQRAGLYD